jgi:hypothetical protein
MLAIMPAVPSRADAIDLFSQRVNGGRIRFVGIDPNQLGDPDAPPVVLAQVEDTDGTLGKITVQSPGFWRWVGKGLIVVGTTAGGTLGGAAAGTAIPGLGNVAGAVIGGGAGLLTGVGTAIVANTTPPAPAPQQASTNPLRTQDVAIYDKLTIATNTGTIDLAGAIINGVLSDPGVSHFALPGGGTFYRPSATLFAGSNILDALGNPLSNGEVQVGVIDAGGSNRAVAVIFQDLVRGIHLDDQVHIFLDNIISPSSIQDGNAVLSRQIFAITVPEPESLVLLSLGAAALLRYAWSRGRPRKHQERRL